MLCATLPISDRLKTDTAHAHAALEKEMLGHLRAVNSLESYARFLRRIHAFLAPLQERIHAAFDASLLLDYSTRRTPRWIEEDLARLPNVEDTPPAQRIPRIPDTAAVFGALYVLEGSTLGGQVIAGMLQKSTDDAALPLRYFRSYGEETRARWQAFRTALNAFADDAHPDAADRILAGANDTFTAYRAWLQTTDWKA